MQQTQKKYKTRHDWVEKVIHLELCKKFKFDHMNKWYMKNPVSVLENDTHKLLWDFGTQTDHLILARRPDLIIINKKKENLQNCGLCYPSWPQNKIESEKKDKYLDLARELKKLWDMKVTIDWCFWYSHQRIIKGTGGLGSWRISGDHPNIALLRMARILRRVLETWGDLLSLKLQ